MKQTFNMVSNVNISLGNVDPLYCPSVLLPIRYTAHPTYCNIRPTTAVYFCIIRGFGQVKTIFEPSAAARTGQGAERRGQDRGPGAAARSPSSSCKTMCQQVGWAQVQKYTIISLYNIKYYKCHGTEFNELEMSLKSIHIQILVNL